VQLCGAIGCSGRLLEWIDFQVSRAPGQRLSYQTRAPLLPLGAHGEWDASRSRSWATELNAVTTRLILYRFDHVVRCDSLVKSLDQASPTAHLHFVHSTTSVHHQLPNEGARQRNKTTLINPVLYIHYPKIRTEQMPSPGQNTHLVQHLALCAVNHTQEEQCL
jgi:hypothetical protein